MHLRKTVRMTSLPRLPLPAATWFAVELARTMLGRNELLAPTPAIRSQHDLLAFSERCADAIASQWGEERAERFRAQVHGAMQRRQVPQPELVDDWD
jgi:hypothetical protein